MLKFVRRHGGLVVKLLLLVLLIVVGHVLSEWIVGQIQFEATPRNASMVHGAIMAAAVAYALLLACPFIPGVEIGLVLLAMFGAEIAPLVYLCTVAGLCISFLVGARIPEQTLIRSLGRLGLARFSRTLERMAHRPLEQRLRMLLEGAPNRWTPTLIRYRYLALMVGFNIPGNALIGGGGGIALMAGMSRLFYFPAFLLAVAVAVSPVPLAVALIGV